MRKKLLIILIIILSSSIFAAEEELIQNFLNDVIIYDIAADETGLWIATYGNGIFYKPFNKNEFKNFSSATGDLREDLFYTIEANKDYVWAGSTDGLFIFDKKRERWTQRKFGKGGQFGNWIRALKFDPYLNALWIGRFKFLTKLDIEKRRFTDYDLTVNKNLKTNTIQTIELDGDSLVWIGTEAGLHKYDKSFEMDSSASLTYFDNKLNYFGGEGESVSVSDVLIYKKNVWIGLDEFKTKERPEYNVGGLYRFNRKNEWFRFDKSSGFAGNGIYSIERTGNYLWVGLYDFNEKTKQKYGRGIALVDLAGMQAAMIKDKLIPNSVYSILFDGENLWIGSEKGLLKINLVNRLAKWD